MPNQPRQNSITHLLDRIYHQYRSYFSQLFVISLFFELPQLILGQFLPQTTTAEPNWQLISQGKISLSQYFSQLLSPSPTHGSIWGAVFVFLIVMLDLNVFTPLLYGSYYSFVHTTTKQNASSVSKVRTSTLIQQAREHWAAFLSTLWLLIGLSFVGVIVLALLFTLIVLVSHVLPLLIPLYLLTLAILIWLIIRLYFVFPAVIFENKRNWRALIRSWQLTKGRFWWNLLVLGVAQLILSFAYEGFSAITSLLPGIAVQTFFGWIFMLLVQPLYALLIANIFRDLQNR